MKMTPRHYYIVFVSSLGQIIGTAVATLAGIIIPMLNIILHPELSTFMQGLIGAIDLIGIAIGSLIFGRLSDKYGYLLYFRLCPLLMFASCVVAILFPSVAVLTVCLFFIGLGIGGEYSLDSNYVSELMPVKYRSLMVGVAKAACALGNIIVAAICFGLLELWKDATAWPKLLWIIAIIAGVMFLLRLKFYESPKWLLDHGQKDKAEIAVKKFLGPDVVIEPEEDQPKATASAPAQKTSMFSFIGCELEDSNTQRCAMGVRRSRSLWYRSLPPHPRYGTRSRTLYPRRKPDLPCRRFRKNYPLDQLHHPPGLHPRPYTYQ